MSQFDFAGMMKEAQRLQEQMLAAQSQLEHQIVEGTAGSGMVRVKATGAQRITSIELDPAVLQEDREMIQDLLIAAVNNALEKAKSTAQDQLGALLPEGGLPPGFPGL